MEPLAEPRSVESYCATKPVHELPRTGAMANILTSVYERLPSEGEAPSLQQYRRGLAAGGGAIAHYDGLKLLKPELAKQLGENGDYIVVRSAMISNAGLTETSKDRYVYVDVLDHGSYRWHALRAADTSNVCSQGHRML